MTKRILAAMLLLFFTAILVRAQVTVQAGLAFNGSNLIVSAKANDLLDGYFSGGKVTITWPTSYNITLGTIVNTTGVWAVSGSGISGGNNYVNFSSTTPSSFSWTSESVNVLFTVPVTVTSGSGSFNLVNGVPNILGNWYFEVGGVERSNTSNSFYCPSVTLGSSKVQAGITNTGTKLTVNALPDANLNGNFSNGVVTIAWPSSYAVTLGTITNNAGTWQVTGSGTNGSNNYVNFVNVAVNTPINWTGGTSHPLFSVEVNQTGSGKGTFSLLNGVPNARTGSWYFEFGGSNLTNNTSPFYTQLISQVPLPVELTSFEAQNRNDNVELKWATATEVNNFGFELERKTSSWEKIAFIPGSGNSNHPKQYSYIDEKPVYGTDIYYRIKQIDNDGKYKYYDPIRVTLEAPKEFRLLQNSPNPFNPVTAIKFQLPVVSRVSIIVYNILGREVATLVNEDRSAGSHIVYWNGRDNQGTQVASGIYLYRIQAGNYSETRKMNLMK